MALAQKQIHKSMQQDKEPRNEAALTWAINLQQRKQEHTMWKK